MSLNLLLIGDSSCGKSHFASLITRRGYLKYIETADDTYVSFYQKIERTKGCDFRTAVREQFKLSIYELSGDKNQRKYLDIYMSQKHELIDGIIYCFDVNNLKTLENLRKWIRFLMKQEN